MPTRLDQLTAAQRRAVTHEGGPLLVLGGAGTGKTRVLIERLVWLAERRVPAEDVLLVTQGQAAADVLRRQVEDALAPPFGELAVQTVPDLCAKLLREHAVAAGIDPFFVPLTPADRLAMLLERMEQLTLRRHDFLGNPAALLGGVVERIDRCKAEGVTAEQYGAWAAGLPEDDEEAEREREFAQLFADHDRLLAEHGTLDDGDLVLRALQLLRDRPGICERFRHVLVDEYQDHDRLHLQVLGACGAHGRMTVAGDDDGSVARGGGGAATRNLREFTAQRPQATVVALERAFRSREAILRAARAVVQPIPERLGLAIPEAAPGGDVEFWRAANERTQAQAVAADVERLIREGVRPEKIAVLVRSVRSEGQAVTVALEERAVPFRVIGAAAFFQRAEVRDVLAWLRLLVDPNDAGAVVRALARPPIELRAADLARCIQISRRRKLDMISALVAATESPQLPPEARDHIFAFLRTHRQLAADLDTTRPDLYVHRLIEALGLRRQQLFSASADVVERLRNLARFGELAADYVRRSPQATAREFGRAIAAVAEAGLREEEAGVERPSGVAVASMRSIGGHEFDHVYVVGLHSARMPGARRQAFEPLPDALLHRQPAKDPRAAHATEMRRVLHVAMTRAKRGLVLAYAEHSDKGILQHPSPFVEEARAALGATWEERAEQLFGPDETLHASFRELRDELLEELPRVGTRLGELRFDTDLDVTHTVVRYLELVKLAALLERPAGQSVADALPGINARLLGAVSTQQADILESSPLDEALLEAEQDERARAAAIARRAEPSLEPFLPKKGEGVMLSASDIDTYRTCPLKYKFARVFRIPQEPTLNQRFGIAVHQVLERFHAPDSRGTLDEIQGLLEAAWRRGGFGDSDQERQLLGKARTALERYVVRTRAEDSEPVWFERQFTFNLGPHVLRGRVDRVDRHPDGLYELIDYKTGRPKTPSQLRDDVQLAVYALAAQDAWDLEAARQSYHYVLDDQKVPLPPGAVDRDWISETVFTVAEGILSQGFEPTPSYTACSMCDYRIVCPAAER
ncbi:MAG TPA: ATP-dependent DNA helicase [Solirubrobacteraceae bacterium]|nr:ATP-dependent DNA helicase [Solirubrobacteraceae bacterium]